MSPAASRRSTTDGIVSDGRFEAHIASRATATSTGTYTPTYGRYSTPGAPRLPAELGARLSPDGTKIAYGIYGCGAGGYETALWTPAGSTGLDFPDQTLGQQDFWEPTWIDNSRFAISHAGPPVFGAHFGEHLVTDGDNDGAGWTASGMEDRSAHAVISRDGKEAVVFFDDAADFSDGKPRNLDMWVYVDPTMPSDFSDGWPDPSAGCQFQFSDPSSRFSDMGKLSPTLSPDGSKVMWGEDDGIHLMSLGDVSSACDGATSTDNVAFIPGGSDPFYAKGNLQPAAANPRQPGAAVTPPGGTPPATTPTGTLGKLLAKFRVVTKKAKLRARKKISFDARFELGGARQGRGLQLEVRRPQEGHRPAGHPQVQEAGHVHGGAHRARRGRAQGHDQAPDSRSGRLPRPSGPAARRAAPPRRGCARPSFR